MSWRRNLPLLLLASMSLASGGCLVVAAGAAGAGAATYFYVRGKLCQEYYASFADSWQAAVATLEADGLKVTHQENNGTDGTISSKTTDGHAISINLSSRPGYSAPQQTVTRICIRVGTFGDEKVSSRILTEIGTRLVPPGVQPRTPAGAQLKTPGWNEPQETPPPPEVRTVPVPSRK